MSAFTHMDDLKYFPTAIPDINREILLRLNIKEIENTISAYSELKDELNNWFWQRLFIRDFVDLGPGIDYKELYYQVKDMNNDNMLVFAAKNGYTNLVAFVLDRSTEVPSVLCGVVDLDRIDIANRALVDAAENGHLSVVQLFVTRGIKNNEAFFVAAKQGYLPIIKYFVESGVDTEDGLHAAIYAAGKGHFDIVNYLFDVNVDRDMFNDRLLKYSIFLGHIDMVRILMDHGAKISLHELYAINREHNKEAIDYVLSVLEKQQSNTPAKKPSAQQCLGITKQGTQCKRKPIAGEKYCNLHKH